MTTRRLRSRGATVTVTAHGQVLAAPGGVVNNWTNRFTQQIGAKTRKAAPRNKRTRWAHYGAPLKKTIMASKPQVRNTSGGFKIYGSAGSTAHYALFVDQGTKSFDAKILPPYYWGSPSLYEHSWEPLGRGSRLGTVHVRGQAAQQFFAKGLAAAFRHMRMRSFQVPADPTVSNVLKTVPRGLTNYNGGTPTDGAFVSQLEEWRRWRDDAWNSGGRLGRFRGLADPEQSRMREEAWERTKEGRDHANYVSTGRAQRKRRKDQIEDLLSAEDRKALREQRAAIAEMEAAERLAKTAEEAAKSRADKATRAAEREAEEAKRKAFIDRAIENRAEAYGYWELLKKAYPEAGIATVKLPDGTVTYVVRWFTEDGEEHRTRFDH